MLIHASCAARHGHGVLLIGAPGAGKSDLLFRLLDHGFDLVADDQVNIERGVAQPPPSLAGLLEVRGLGVVRLPYLHEAPLVLAVELASTDRLPEPRRHPLGLPLIAVDPSVASAPARIGLALDCVLGRVTMTAGALA